MKIQCVELKERLERTDNFHYVTWISVFINFMFTSSQNETAVLESVCTCAYESTQNALCSALIVLTKYSEPKW